MTSRESRAVTSLSEYRDRAISTASAAYALRLPDTASTELPTGTVTFLLTDIEDSTPRWDRDRTAMADAVAGHYRILDAAVLAHAGVRPVEQGEGDSMVAAFPRASDAVSAAMRAQLALASHDWPEGAEIRVRMALHTGEAQLRDGLYYVGPSIIRCARLRALAHGGQVLVSAATAHLLRDALPPQAALAPLGTHRLKGLSEPEPVFALTHPQLRAGFPRLSAPDSASNLPVRSTSFVGRESELRELATLLETHRLVTLVGPGGCGKTRLAAQAAGAAADDHPDGVYWVELATVADPERVPEAALDALGVDAKGTDARTRIVDWVGGRRALIVLDNCEHVLAAAAELSQALLAACPGTTIVTTSREPLQLGAELAWPVHPLSLPPHPGEGPPAVLRDSEAVALFVERAEQARPGFHADDATLRTIAAICTRLDGMPLAIELAAARLRSLTLERLLVGLDDRFRVLTGGSPATPARQRTLAGCIEWSHDQLTDRERVLLARLSVFVGPFEFSGALALNAALDTAGGIEAADTETLLPDLVDCSLVVFDGARYRLLETIREFARRRLETSGESSAARTAHLRHQLDVTGVAARELESGPQLATLERMEAARENVLAAVDFALACGEHEAAMRLCADMALFWQLHGRHGESLACVRRVLAATPADPSPARARMLCAAGQLGFYTMDLPGGYGTVETAAAIEMARALGDDQVLGRALGMQNLLAVFGAPSAAPAGLAEALAAAERAGDPYGKTAAGFYTALAWTFGLDRPDRGADHLDALAADAANSPVWAAWKIFVEGVAAWRAGRLWRAVDLLGRGDELAWSVGDPVHESWCARWLAETYLCLGEWEAAEAVIARSEEWMDRSSFGRLESVASQRIAMGLARGDLAAAIAAREKTEGPARSMGFPLLTLEMAALGARIALATGDVAAARAGLAEATQIGETLGTPWYLALTADLAGRVATAERDPAAAEDAHHRALAVCIEHNFRGAAAGALEHLATLAAVGESHAEAARLLGAAEALRHATGQVRWRWDTEALDSVVAELLEALGPDVLAALRRDGAATDLPQAAAYAARARTERKRPSSGWAALTPTELAVVDLVAQGLTNPQIAARLFITAGTTKVHLTHVYAKLGLANRTQVATAAVARGRPPGG